MYSVIGYYKIIFIHRSDDPPYRVQLTTLINGEIGPTLIKHGLAEPRRFDCHLTETENKRLKNGLTTALE